MNDTDIFEDTLKLVKEKTDKLIESITPLLEQIIICDLKIERHKSEQVINKIKEIKEISAQSIKDIILNSKIYF